MTDHASLELHGVILPISREAHLKLPTPLHSFTGAGQNFEWLMKYDDRFLSLKRKINEFCPTLIEYVKTELEVNTFGYVISLLVHKVEYPYDRGYIIIRYVTPREKKIKLYSHHLWYERQ